MHAAFSVRKSERTLTASVARFCYQYRNRVADLWHLFCDCSEFCMPCGQGRVQIPDTSSKDLRSECDAVSCTKYNESFNEHIPGSACGFGVGMPSSRLQRHANSHCSLAWYGGYLLQSFEHWRTGNEVEATLWCALDVIAVQRVMATGCNVDAKLLTAPHCRKYTIVTFTTLFSWLACDSVPVRVVRLACSSWSMALETVRRCAPLLSSACRAKYLGDFVQMFRLSVSILAPQTRQ